jgi:Tfp pilus assembly protein PilN
MAKSNAKTKQSVENEAHAAVSSSFSLIDINLLPAEFRSSRADITWVTDRRIVWPTLGLFVAVVVGLLLLIHTKDVLGQKEAKLESLKKEVQKEKPLLEKIKKLDKELKIIAEKNKALKSIQVSKKRWVVLFESISSVLPENMWLMNIDQVSVDIIEIKGATYEFSEVAAYMMDLETQISFDKVELVSISSLVQRRDSNESYEFKLKCFVNPNLGLDGAN